MINPLIGLVPDPPSGQPWRMRDGTISSITPLTVLLDGDEDAVAPTKSPLVGGLSIGQRVLALLADHQLIILGRYGG